MTTENAKTWNAVARVARLKNVYRLTFTKDNGIRKIIVGIWTCDVMHALDFISEHENENIYVEIL